jgi:hypothetical protein
MTPPRKPLAASPARPGPGSGKAETDRVETGAVNMPAALTPGRGDVPGERLCLKCAKPFASAGFSERICPHCKGLKLWRDAAPARASFMRQG